jgi:hypothetical protein
VSRTVPLRRAGDHGAQWSSTTSRASTSARTRFSRKGWS